ncbi:MAG: hypothetical protein ACK5Y2_07840 [Bdellovibrionales bacterium]
MKSLVLMLMSLVFVVGCGSRKDILADESNKEHQKRLSQKRGQTQGGQKQASPNVETDTKDDSEGSKDQQPRVFEPAKTNPESNQNVENDQDSQNQKQDPASGDRSSNAEADSKKGETARSEIVAPVPTLIQAPTSPSALNPSQAAAPQASSQAEPKTQSAAPASQLQVQAPASTPAPALQPQKTTQGASQDAKQDSQGKPAEQESSPEVLTLEEFSFVQQSIPQILKGEALRATQPVNIEGVIPQGKGTLESFSIQLLRAGKILVDVKDLKIPTNEAFQGTSGEFSYGGFIIDQEANFIFMTFFKKEGGQATFNFPMILKRIGTQVVVARMKDIEVYKKEAEAYLKAQAEKEKASKSEGAVSDSSDVKQ